MPTINNPIDLSNAAARAVQIRQLYHQLEVKNHGLAWTTQEDLIGLASDIGELGRLIMASEGRWVHTGDLSKDLGDKLSECMWWIFVLGNRLGVDIAESFTRKMDELETNLSASLGKQQ